MVNHQQNHLTGYISLGALGVGGGGVYSLIKSYKYVPPQRVRVLHLSSLKMRIHFAYFGLDSGMFFEGTTSVYEHITLLSQFQMNKKEREICEFATHFK